MTYLTYINKYYIVLRQTVPTIHANKPGEKDMTAVATSATDTVADVNEHERRALELIEERDWGTLVNEIHNFPDGSLSSKVADRIHVHCGMMMVAANRDKFNFGTPWPAA